MSVIDELWRRADFILRGQPMLRLHVDCIFASSENVSNGKPCRVGWFINVNENYKHAFIMTPDFGEECPSVLQTTL